MATPTQRMQLDNSGNLLVGKTTPSAVYTQGCELSSSGGVLGTTSASANSSYFANTGGSGTRYLIRFYGTSGEGNVGVISHDGTSTTYGTTSDYRLKENVVAITDGIARVKQLNPDRFNYIKTPGNIVDGFLAHEVQAVVPEAVIGTKDEVDENGNPIYQNIDQSKIVPLLTAALKEAIARIEMLESKLV